MQTKSEKIRKVKELLNEAKVFYAATVDGDRPRCRPLGFSMTEKDELYFGVGTFKDVYRQLAANPNVEIVASTPEVWLRLSGKAVFDQDPQLTEKCFAMMPGIAGLYQANGWTMGIFRIEHARAEIRQIMNTIETLEW